MTAASFRNRRDITRDVMAGRLVAVFKTADTQAEVISHLEIEAQKLKSDFIKKQEQAFGLQEDLISAKDNQLLELKETIVSSIGDTLQTQLTSNSKAL